MARLVIVSNRVTMPSDRSGSTGGLAVGIRDALRKHSGVWFGWSGKTADATAEAPRIEQFGRVTYATIDLGRVDLEQYYNGYANSTLWPLLHYRLGLIEFTREVFGGYLRVNAAMARALAPLLRPDDLIWVHDYHLIPLGAELRSLGVANRIGFFLHTPFPAPAVLEALPRYDTLLEAMSAYDLVGFQTDHDLRAFRDCVVHLSGGRLLEDDGIAAFGRVARAATFPIGIDPEEFASAAVGTASSLEAERLRASLVGRALIIGVDRLDYSKGLPNRFEAFGQLLARSPEWRGRMTFMQIAPRSRSDVRQYRELRRHLEQVAGRINGRFAEPDWTPLRYLNKGFPRRTLASFYRIARVGLVTPLRDGMNLVAKEYVAAQDPADPGALVLSRFAGAARELTSALLVNPFDIDEIADTMQRALAMPRAERIERWEAMMDALRANSIATWRDRFIAALQHPAMLPEPVSSL